MNINIKGNDYSVGSTAKDVIKETEDLSPSHCFVISNYVVNLVTSFLVVICLKEKRIEGDVLIDLCISIQRL